MIEPPYDPNFDYNGFASRLADAISPEKITAFANRAGVPQGTVSKYLKAQGNGPRLDIAARLADAAKVSLDWLVWGRGEGRAEGYMFIPRYDATLAAGAGTWNEGRIKIEDFPVTPGFVRELYGRPNVNGLCLLHVRGDSMYPTIADRAIVLVDEHDTHVVDDVYAFVLGGDARVKRFHRILNGFEIISDNPTYPRERLTNGGLEGLQIIGRVLRVQNPV